MKRAAPKWRVIVPGACLYLAALVLMHASLPTGVQRETIQIEGPSGKPCLGTLWMPQSPKAVIVIGHGVSANQGIMTAAANVVAQGGLSYSHFARFCVF